MCWLVFGKAQLISAFRLSYLKIIQNAPPPHHHFRPATGMGCHPNRWEFALKRALTEAAQSRLTFIAGARDDMPRAEYIKHLQEDMYDSWRRKIEKTSHQRHFRDRAAFPIPQLGRRHRLAINAAKSFGNYPSDCSEPDPGRV